MTRNERYKVLYKIATEYIHAIHGDCEKCPAYQEICEQSEMMCPSPLAVWMLDEDGWFTDEEPDTAEPSKSTSDEIRPDWYKITPEIEAWDVINPILNRCDYTGECIGYLKDILKYVLRADQKNGLEDYKKAYTNMKQLIRALEEGGEA